MFSMEVYLYYDICYMNNNYYKEIIIYYGILAKKKNPNEYI